MASTPFRRSSRLLLAVVIFFTVFFIAPSLAPAADVHTGWKSWWLPPVRSVHGPAIDSLFTTIFWITMITFVAVQATLIVFMIMYRHKPGKKKAKFIHGNTRLEMAWTLAPAIILAVLALWSKKVWDGFRYNPVSTDADRAKVLVIGEQFKWNIIYPGPDGKFGRYLLFPKPSDPTWPAKADGTPDSFAGVLGPAALPYDKAVNAINDYIAQVNSLGKVFSDPDGLDDLWQGSLGRQLELPVNRSIEIQLSSKDVIHDFFLPNYRVKLDAVPGMKGLIYFTATTLSKEPEKVYDVSELETRTGGASPEDFVAVVDETSEALGAENTKPKGGRAKFWRYADAGGATIVRHGDTLNAERVAKLKAAGKLKVKAYKTMVWDLVCEELCGQGHYTMQGQVIVLSQEEYAAKYEGKAAATPAATSAAPATQPVAEAN